MRLLYVRGPELIFREFSPNEIPPYAFASHRWTSEEVKLKDIRKRRNTESLGFKKVEAFARYVKEKLPGVDYVWYDSCCINQDSSAELSEAINSMFRWCQQAEICLAYLADVEEPGDEEAFRDSVWHTRGWTLQELVSPSCVLFLSKNWEIIGHKGSIESVEITAHIDLGPSLEGAVSAATGIAENVLRDCKLVNECSIDEKLDWTKNRTTLKPEDLTYCLFGIFGIALPANYGEGSDMARKRFLDEIGRRQRPKPILSIPYPQDQDFVVRQELSDRIDVLVAASEARVALVGLGGVGKTQILIDYAYRTRQQSPDTWVIWIHASNFTRFLESVREFADRVDLPGRDNPNADLLKLFRAWLCNQSHSPWMILMDNLDDAQFLVEPLGAGEQKSTLLDHLPSCEGCRILITSREADEALRIVPSHAIVSVDPMDNEHSTALLKNKLGDNITAQDSRELAEALDNLPLAISQASAYIQWFSPRLSVQGYLRQLESSREARTRLLGQEPTIHGRDRDASSSVLLTWQVSFEHLQRKKRSAAGLLGVMSLCDRQAMPECLLREGYTWDNKGHRIARGKDSDVFQQLDNDTFEDDIATLRGFAFITLTTNTSSWSMHRLVQDSTRQWLSEKDLMGPPMDTFLRRLELISPFGGFENWETCRMLRPHVRSAGEIKPSTHDAWLNWATIMHRASDYLLHRGSYAEAESLARKGMDVRIRLLSKESDSTLDIMDSTATALANLGRLPEAESLIQEVIEIHCRMHGGDDSAVCGYLRTLSKVFWLQGRYWEEGILLTRIADQMVKKWGPKHRITVITMNDLAVNLKNQGHLIEAEELYLEVINCQREISGENCPDLFATLNNLASVYARQKRWKDAETILVDLLQTQRAVLGDNYPGIWHSVQNLAEIYRNQGRSREAEDLHTQAFDNSLASFGADHPSTLSSKSELAKIWAGEGKLEEAERAFVEVLVARAKLSGRECTEVLESMYWLAYTYCFQGRLDEADELFAKVAENGNKVYGPEHPSALLSMYGRARIYYDRGKLDEAAELFAKVVEGSNKVNGVEPCDTQNTKKWLEVVRRKIHLRDKEREAQARASADERQEERHQSCAEVKPGREESYSAINTSPTSVNQSGKASSQVLEISSERRKRDWLRNKLGIRSRREIAQR